MRSSSSAFGTVHASFPRSFRPASDRAQLCRRLKALARVRLGENRDFGPSRQFRQTADVVGCSESTLRRRAEQWNWVERLADYDSGMLQQASEARTKEDLERYKHQLETFRQEQLARARTVIDEAFNREHLEHSITLWRYCSAREI